MTNKNKTKELIYLTDITFHTRKLRPTNSFEKAKENNRMYFKFNKTKSNDFTIELTLPHDLVEKINNGEVKMLISKNNSFMFAGRDTLEKLEADKNKEKRQIIHRGRKTFYRK